MDKIIPFFYYDIMSRIIPGGVTLALLGLLIKHLPERWASLFGGEQSWKAVVVPLILGALAYMIGVCYESIDYSAPIKWLVLAGDKKAFLSAWSTFRKESGDHISKKTSERPGVSRFSSWESLVFGDGRERGQNSSFAHCHRFQAEYKMFLHLIYPSLLFVGAAFYRCEILRGAIVLFIVVPMLFYFGHRRDERRWLQALCFGEQLDLLNREKVL